MISYIISWPAIQCAPPPPKAADQLHVGWLGGASKTPIVLEAVLNSGGDCCSQWNTEWGGGAPARFRAGARKSEQDIISDITYDIIYDIISHETLGTSYHMRHLGVCPAPAHGYSRSILPVSKAITHDIIYDVINHLWYHTSAANIGPTVRTIHQVATFIWYHIYYHIWCHIWYDIIYDVIYDIIFNKMI